jgi:hypothetical protein
MPSPFPGMDPFIEGQEWHDFRHGFIVVARAALVQQVRPKYVVRIEERDYPDEQADEDFDTYQDERPQRYLAGRELESMRMVTVIELLSLADKQPGTKEFLRYRRIRDEVLQSDRHLVELDLLRGGERPPGLEVQALGDYRAMISRVERRPQAEVYAWTLRQPLPTVPVPLAGGDPDAAMDLQAIFTSAYDRSGYDYSLDYRRPVEPPLSEVDSAWVRETLAQR